jgi:hypothetical protein
MSKFLAKRFYIFCVLVSLLNSAVAGAVRTKVFDAPMGGVAVFSRDESTNIVTSLIPKLIGVSSDNVVGEWYAGYTSAGDLLDLTGQGRTLADTASPPVVFDSVALNDNNPLQAFSYDGSTQYHSRAHESWMNMFSTSHSLVMVVKAPTSAPVGSSDILFCHGAATTDGFYVYLGTDGKLGGGWHKAGSILSALSSSTMVDGNYHIIHVVRNGDVGKIYVDGVAGTETTGLNAGYGLDGSRTLYIARYVNAGLEYNSPIAYTRLQTGALTFTQIQREVSLFQGVLGGATAGYFDFPTFQRSTAIYSDRKTGSAGLTQFPADWVNKTPGGANLIQASATQLLTYTGAFSTNWTKTNSSIAATSVTLPDGSTGTTNTLHEDGTAGVQHYASIIVTPVSGSQTYCVSMYFKYNPSAAVPREWVRVQLHDGTNLGQIYFNIRTGVNGTTGGTIYGGSGIESAGNGWYRGKLWVTTGVAANTLSYYLYVAEADTDPTFDGQNQDSVFIYGPQLETGTFPTSYIPRVDATAASRSGDLFHFIPWRLNKNLASKVNATPRLLFKGSESLNAATVTPTTGAYTFTKNGRPQNGSSKSEGNYLYFNGSTDYLSLANGSGGSDFNPSGDFSVVVTYTPKNVSAIQYIAAKWNVTGDKRGWLLYHQNGNIVFYRSTDGTAANSAFAIVFNCIQVGKPVLVTASYSTVNGLTLRVDALTAGTQAAIGTVYSTNADLTIGAVSTGALFSGGIHYLAYYNNYVVSASEHDAMYTAFKQDSALPLTMSSTTAKKKLSIEFDAKCLFASSTDIGATRQLFDIGGTVGLSSTTKNRVTMYVNTSGVLIVGMYNNSADGLLRDMYSGANNVVFNKWNNYKTTFDFSNLANSTLTVNDVSEKDNTANLTGAQEIKFHDALIRLGQGVEAYPISSCEYRNVKLFVE